METLLCHISTTPAQTGLPAAIHPERFTGKSESQLTHLAGLTQFGVNIVTLAPGAWSALRHWHEGEDEFVYVLAGHLTLIDDNGAHALTPGSFAGFPAGRANAHHIANHSDAPASFLVIGTRKQGVETIHYPDDFAKPRTIRRDVLGQRESG